jgi:hypothetical protein
MSLSATDPSRPEQPRAPIDFLVDAFGFVENVAYGEQDASSTSSSPGPREAD